MITSWEELGEILAEFELRIEFLENSLPYKREAEEPKPEPEILVRTYLSVDKKTLELQQRIVSLEENIKKLRPITKARPKYKY